jgi:hypothetical protein
LKMRSRTCLSGRRQVLVCVWESSARMTSLESEVIAKPAWQLTRLPRQRYGVCLPTRRRTASCRT